MTKEGSGRKLESYYLVFIMCCKLSFCSDGPTYKLYTPKEQNELVATKRKECHQLIGLSQQHNSTSSTPAAVRCPRNFDGIYCWPDTDPNITVSITCPDYVNMFDYSENASRTCTAGGEWLYNNATSSHVADYTNCYRYSLNAAKNWGPLSDFDPQGKPFISDIAKEHVGNIQMLYTIGYSVSLISLSIALAIMLMLRRLHCPRNTIHMNMFVSFILRGAITLLHDHITAAIRVKAIGINGMQAAWYCKLLTALWMYTRLSNLVWITIEGFYLHMLIFINTFSDKSSIGLFILVGWLSPLLAVIPWTIVRLVVDDIGCWTIYKNRVYRWIIEVPIVLLIAVNFMFFVIIIRLLFTKLRASESSSREMHIYRKLAKSTLVLIPLFGVHYVVFLFGEFKKNDTLEVVRFYFDSFFTSFQGLLVGILFCFLNGEVQSEILKRWKRWRSQNMRFPSTQFNTVSLTNQRTSISLDMESTAPTRSGSRRSSLPTPPVIPEESHLLLKFDSNQNDLRIEAPSFNNCYTKDEGRA